MNIIEATRKAMESGKGIVNTNWSSKSHYLLPTNTIECYIVVPFGFSVNSGKAYPRWNPRADDILSDGWELNDRNEFGMGIPPRVTGYETCSLGTCPKCGGNNYFINPHANVLPPDYTQPIYRCSDCGYEYFVKMKIQKRKHKSGRNFGRKRYEMDFKEPFYKRHPHLPLAISCIALLASILIEIA